MTAHALWFMLLAFATIVDGLLAGASLDQSIEQLPARHRIGVLAYRAALWRQKMKNNGEKQPSNGDRRQRKQNQDDRISPFQMLLIGFELASKPGTK